MNTWLCNAAPWHEKIGWEVPERFVDAQGSGMMMMQFDDSLLIFMPWISDLVGVSQTYLFAQYFM